MISITNSPPKVCLSDNPAIVQVLTDLATGDNLHVLVQPRYWNESDPIGTDIIYPPYEGSARSDISEYLKSYFSKPAPVSEWFNYPVAPVAVLIENRSMRYHILLREGTGFPASYNDLEFNNRYVVPGIIPKWIRNFFYKNWYSYWEWIQNVKPFLTFAPTTRIVTKSEVIPLYWLCWYNHTEGHALNLKVNLKFSDGTSADWTKDITPASGVDQYYIYQIPADYTALGIEAYLQANYPAKILVSYSIVLLDVSTVVSEVRTFVIDYKANPGNIQLVFSNSAGGYDGVLLSGVAETKRDHTSEQINVLDTDAGMPERRTHIADAKETVKASTGWLTPGMRLYLSELLISKDVYEITSSGLQPVIILPQNTTMAKDRETLPAIDIEFERVVKFNYENGL